MSSPQPTSDLQALKAQLDHQQAVIAKLTELVTSAVRVMKHIDFNTRDTLRVEAREQRLRHMEESHGQGGDSHNGTLAITREEYKTLGFQAHRARDFRDDIIRQLEVLITGELPQPKETNEF